MISLRLRVTLIAVGCLVLTLTLVGVGTAGLLHQRARTSLDQTLLAAAAFAEAHPWQEERFANQHVGNPVDVRPWDPEHPIVPPSLHQRAIHTERPVWVDQHGHRTLLLAVEQEGQRPEQHHVVVATAPAIHWRSTVLPFLLTYLTVSLVFIGVAAAFLFIAIFRALEPLELAVIQVGQVGALDLGRRLPTDGPPEVQSLLRATNALLDRLQSAFELQGRFTSQAAHELRTPVTVLKGEIELALRRPRSVEEHVDTLRRLQADVTRLQALVEGLMLLARVDAGQIEQGRSIERVSAPLHTALAQEHETLEAAGCEVTVHLNADPEISIHVALLTTAIATLLRNVALHAPGSSVAISTHLRSSTVEISIHDHGPGIEEPERMLERFTRGSSWTGLGLGLPIAQEIARRHGGDLEIRSEPGAGTLAQLTLPAPTSNEAPS